LQWLQLLVGHDGILVGDDEAAHGRDLREGRKGGREGGRSGELEGGREEGREGG